MARHKAIEIDVSRQNDSKTSRTRSQKAVTIFRCKPQVDGPFYSGAMQCWRIQFYQRGETYHYSRESSLYIERIEDGLNIAPLVPKVQTWEDWVAMIEDVKKIMRASTSGGYCYVTGLSQYRTPLHVEAKA